ncbi:branched-chain amino acid ABC transporter permease [Pyrofollis japonicus]|uniref:branched-chain amino acid ABC transporter permease n=1 Tax=Pyrofollis japonicus TaxID=3060460 RepID=UPI00295C01E0|nr:branched-chain amino acid ABC transporter permease [Pyrofollis japonicus]BEP17789.1 branched-chain amino acid ABC transporter permease [Pyrofollis japonicus]
MAVMSIQSTFQALYYASLLSILSVGVTLSYMTTKVFNFAHVRFAMVSSYVAATVILLLVRALGIHGDFAWKQVAGLQMRMPLPWWVYAAALVAAFVVGGLVAVAQYYLVLRPLQRRGAGSMALMISTLGFDFVLIAILFIYMTLPQIRRMTAEAIPLIGKVSFDSLGMDSLDIVISTGSVTIRGAVILAIVFALATIIGLYLLLTRTKLGIMMRSSIENPRLSLVLGINVDRVFAITWFIAGAIAGLAGYLFIFATVYLARVSPTSPSDQIIVSVFAGSIVGGINSVPGSIGGGFLIGLIEKFFVPLLSGVTGPGIVKYDKVFSMLAVALTLLFIPEGLASVNWRRLFRSRSSSSTSG